MLHLLLDRKVWGALVPPSTTGRPPGTHAVQMPQGRVERWRVLPIGWKKKRGYFARGLGMVISEKYYRIHPSRSGNVVGS